MSTEAPPLPTHRLAFWKRILIWFVGLLFVVALVVLVAGARTAHTGRSTLADVMAETDQLDPRWRWEDVDADRPLMANVGNSVMRIHAVVQAKGRWDNNELLTVDRKDLLGETPINHRLDAERLTLLRKALSKREEAVALAVSLKDMPRGRAPLTLTPDAISTLLPYAQESRDVVHLLQLDNERRLHDGAPGDVPERVRAMLHSGASLRDEPFLISQLVRLACRTVAARQVERSLGMAELRDEECRQLADHFAMERADNLMLSGVRGERAAMHLMFTNLSAGRVDLAELYRHVEGRTGAAGSLVIRGGAMLYGPRVFEDHANFLRWSNRACTIAALPIHKQAAEWATYDKEFKAFVAESRGSLRNLITVLLMPAIAKVSEAARRDQALLACVETALAAERFRLANKRWPATLEELTPKYVKEVPIDAHSGKALLMTTTEDGIVIYSTGSDGVDDGGRTLDVRPKAGTDFGVRLWNRNRRGLEVLKMPNAE